MEVREHNDEFETQIRVREYLQILLGRLRWFAGALVLVTAAMSIYTLSSPPTYRAQAKLLVEGEQSKRPSAFQMLGNMGGLAGALDLSGFIGASSIETQLEIIRSRDVLGKAKADLHVPNPDDMPEVEITNIKATNIIQIQCDSSNPKIALQLAEGISRNYMDSTLERKRASSKQTRELVARELATAQQHLSETEDRLWAFGEQGGLVTSDTSAVRNVLDRQLAQREAASQLRAKVAATRTQIATLQREIARKRPFVVNSRAMSPNPLVSSLRAELAKLQTERSHLLQRDYAVTSRKMTEIDAQIANIQSQIDRETREIVGSQTQVEPVEASLRQQLEAARVQLIADKQASQEADEALERINDEAAVLPENLQRGAALRREFDLAQEKYLMLASKHQECLMTEEAITAGAVVLEDAVVSQAPVSPDVKKGLLIAVFAGVLAGLLTAIGADHRIGNFVSVEQVESVLHLPVLATIPEYVAEDIVLCDPDDTSPLAASFRTLSASLQVLDAKQALGTLMVVSAGESAGKTMVAANLATAMAASGKRVILVDGALKQPRLHQVFGIDNTTGLAQCLTGEQTVEESLRHTPHGNLQLLVAGTSAGHLEHLLTGAQMQAVSRHLLTLADYVIFDTSESLLVSVGWVVSGVCDTTLVVADMVKTKRGLARQQVRTLIREGARIIGAAANRNRGGWGSAVRSDYSVYSEA